MSQESFKKNTPLSVIVVSFSDLPTLDVSLSSLQQQKSLKDTEVCVVRDWSFRRRLKDGVPIQSDGEKSIRTKFKNMKWIDAPARCTVPQMRLLGLQESGGEIVAFTEDDCVLSGTYVSDLIAAHRAPNVAIGGAVEPGNYSRALDWAIFFCEYARFMRPFEGTVPYLPGNNVSYKRPQLERLLEENELGDGIYEVFVNEALMKSGETLLAKDEIYVQNVNSWPSTQATRVPYNHGRGFAAMRFADDQAWKRILYAYIALALPAVQTYRIVKQVYLRQKYFAEIMKALPIIVLFCTSWSWGELAGYLMGPGRSLEEWR